MSTMLNERTLLITNPLLAELGCHALSGKIRLSGEETKLCVKANSIVVDDIGKFVQAKSGSRESADGRLGCDELLDGLKSNRELKVFPPIGISPQPGKQMVVTLWDGKRWNELVGEKVEIWRDLHACVFVGDVLSEPIYIKVYLSYDSGAGKVNRATMANLHLTQNDEAVRENYYDPVISYRYTVKFPAKLLYSIETRGKTVIPPEKFTEQWESRWTPDRVLFASLRLTVDYDRKIIYGNYWDDGEIPGGRRTSNGWEDKYRSCKALFYKSFDLIFSLEEYIGRLPDSLAAIGGMVRRGGQDDGLSLSRSLTVEFEKELPFAKINEILQFDVSGSEYHYYV